jgi:phospho-N-acetylmuramoyl-pentapeptide-transferase
MVLSAATSLIATLLCGPFFIRKLCELKLGQPLRNFKGFLLAELHKQKKDTPTMGGILIILSVIVSMALYLNWDSLFSWLLLGALLVFGSIGMVDDWAKLKNKNWRGIPGRVRMSIQTLFAIVLMLVIFCPEWVGYRPPTIMSQGSSLDWFQWQGTMQMPFFVKPIFVASGLTWIVILLLQWITVVGAANAVNLTDGLDGLAAGCTVFAAAALALVAFVSNNEVLALDHSMPYIQSSGEIAVALAALIGACLGFLWFNSYPAQVFMGDTGSLAIGGLLGTSAVLMRREWFLAVIGGIFVLETLSVIVQVFSYKGSGKRIFRCTPIHHHFEYGGMPEAKVVVRFWLVAALFAVIGIASLFVRIKV